MVVVSVWLSKLTDWKDSSPKWRVMCWWRRFHSLSCQISVTLSLWTQYSIQWAISILFLISLKIIPQNTSTKRCQVVEYKMLKHMHRNWLTIVACFLSVLTDFLNKIHKMYRTYVASRIRKHRLTWMRSISSTFKLKNHHKIMRLCHLMLCEEVVNGECKTRGWQMLEVPYSIPYSYSFCRLSYVCATQSRTWRDIIPRPHRVRHSALMVVAVASSIQSYDDPVPLTFDLLETKFKIEKNIIRSWDHETMSLNAVWRSREWRVQNTWLTVAWGSLLHEHSGHCGRPSSNEVWRNVQDYYKFQVIPIGGFRVLT